MNSWGDQRYDDYDSRYEGGYDRQYQYDSYGHSGGYVDEDPYPSDTPDVGYDQIRDNKIPESVVSFLTYFASTIHEGQLFEIQSLYENNFPKLTEQYYDKRPWPDETLVKQIVNDDNVFMILYKELYYRHLYARLPQTLTFAHRYNSFLNYCDLLNALLSCEKPLDLVLPDQWLWELIDEFIYQFQSYSQYRARLKNKTPEEILEINNNFKTWNILCVLNVLHSLVDKSNIKKQLEVYASGGDPNSVAGEFGRHSLYKMLGYFSLVGLLRLHSLLGDYYQAIKVLENIEIHKKSQYSHIPACQISTSYYVGFAYMMMRRYSDAIRTFSSILLYIQRTKQLFKSRTYQNDQINKQTEQMYHLLAICLVLHPQCIDDSIQQHLREKGYHEKMYNMQCGDMEEFEANFQFACPKFLLAAPPSTNVLDDYTKDAILHQTEVFMDEVRQQKMLPTIRSYLKLYTTLPLSKLAAFMSQGSNKDLEKESAELRTHLLCFKHKMKNVVWTKGTSGLEGSFQSGSELDFYIDHDMIHIADTKVASRYGDFFIKKILKFEELNMKLHAIKI